MVSAGPRFCRYHLLLLHCATIPFLFFSLPQKKLWKGASRRAVSKELKRRAEERQQKLMEELIAVTAADAQGLRTRINFSFDEWTDRNKRSWLAVNVSYCNRDGDFVARLMHIKSFTGVKRKREDDNNDDAEASSSSAASNSSSK